MCTRNCSQSRLQNPASWLLLLLLSESPAQLEVADNPKSDHGISYSCCPCRHRPSLSTRGNLRDADFAFTFRIGTGALYSVVQEEVVTSATATPNEFSHHIFWREPQPLPKRQVRGRGKYNPSSSLCQRHLAQL